jgi:hypothetical protein
MVGEPTAWLRVQPQRTCHLERQIAQVKPLVSFRPGVEARCDLFTTSPFPSRRVARHVRHTVPRGLSLPCGGKHTTGYGCPSTRGSGLEPATASAPAGAGARREAVPQSADSSARRLRRYRHRGAPASSPPRAARASPPGIPPRLRGSVAMGGVVCAIPDLRAVGSALLRPRLRAVGSFGRAGHTAHATVVHGCAIAHTAEAMPPRLPGHAKLTREWSQRYACLRSGRRIGQCSLAHTDTARLDCPRLALGCQAMFWPPIGSATRSTRRCALPHLIAPRGAQR